MRWCIYLLDFLFEICMLVISFLILLLIINLLNQSQSDPKVFLLSNTAVYSYQRNMRILLFKANFPLKFWINIKYSEIYWFRHKHHFPLQHPDSITYKARFYYYTSVVMLLFHRFDFFCAYPYFMSLRPDLIICTHCINIIPRPSQKNKLKVGTF